MTDFEDKYAAYRDEFEKILSGFCRELDCKPDILAESMKYSLNVGGKRIRPVLMFSVGDVLGIERNKLKNFALALELIHTYSLIHDDLPSMDNDDFRRGKFSNHKVYGEGNAVLAGDGLLNTAYSILFDECAKGANYVCAAKFICECAGVYGMIGGQSADLKAENQKSNGEEELEFIYKNKTGKLISAAIMTPAIILGGKYYTELQSYSESLGFLFQLVDDILDVEGDFNSLGKSVGKDEAENKFTAVGLYGLDKCKFRADLLCDDCLRILEGIEGDVSFLKELTRFVRGRER